MNENCLAGMACPKCKSEGPFDIFATTQARVEDSGVTDVQDFEWDDNSGCLCVDCGHSGNVDDFHVGKIVVPS